MVIMTMITMTMMVTMIMTIIIKMITIILIITIIIINEDDHDNGHGNKLYLLLPLSETEYYHLLIDNS